MSELVNCIFILLGFVIYWQNCIIIFVTYVAAAVPWNHSAWWQLQPSLIGWSPSLLLLCVFCGQSCAEWATPPPLSLLWRTLPSSPQICLYPPLQCLHLCFPEEYSSPFCGSSSSFSSPYPLPLLPQCFSSSSSSSVLTPSNQSKEEVWVSLRCLMMKRS